jgi:hypothetical protein
LLSPDVSAVPNFGQPVIQTSEPCGKRGLIGGRFVATSIFAVIRALRHGAETRNDAALKGKRRPVTLKSRADHTDRTESSQDYVTAIYSIEITGFLRIAEAACGPVAALQQHGIITGKILAGQATDVFAARASSPMPRGSTARHCLKMAAIAPAFV